MAFLKILFLIEISEIQYRAKKNINFAKNEICIIEKQIYLHQSKKYKLNKYFLINNLYI